MEAKSQKAPDFYVLGSKVTDEIKALEQPGNGVIIKGFAQLKKNWQKLYDTTRIAGGTAAVWRRRLLRKGSRGTLQRSSHCDHFRRLPRGFREAETVMGDRRFPRVVCPGSWQISTRPSPLQRI